jgi:hypothetical protein
MQIGLPGLLGQWLCSSSGFQVLSQVLGFISHIPGPWQMADDTGRWPLVAAGRWYDIKGRRKKQNTKVTCLFRSPKTK